MFQWQPYAPTPARHARRAAVDIYPEPIASTYLEAIEAHDVPDATAAEHQAVCLLCYRFYGRGMEAEGWRIGGASFVRDDAPACPCCGGMTTDRLHVRLSRRSRPHPSRREVLRLSVCRPCGHVELLASAPGA